LPKQGFGRVTRTQPQIARFGVWGFLCFFIEVFAFLFKMLEPKGLKVMCHLMFGILALTADQLLLFVT